ncbi:unnamed protein product [Scytosiphon promiscuus]
MSNAGDPERPRPPTAFGRAGKPSKDKDNPFLRQLEIMLEKSANNRAAGSPTTPSLPRAASPAAAIAASPSSAWPPAASPGGPGVGKRFGAANGGRGAGGAVGSWASQIGQPLSAQPKRAATADSGRDTKAGPPRGAGTRSIFSMLDSSDEDDDDDDGRSSVGAQVGRPAPATPADAGPVGVVAEVKGTSGGGWPETKRCSPPNLKALSSGSAAAEHRDGRGGGGGDHRGKDKRVGSSPSLTGGRNAAVNGGSSSKSPGITGDRWYGTAGITGPRASTEGQTGGGLSTAYEARSGVPGSDDEWMSDAEDARGHRGLKRGRTPRGRSPLDGGGSGHLSDSSSNSDGRLGRGRKTGRWSDRYPAPIPARKQRSNSLSLSPPHLLDRGSDYATSEEDDNDVKNTTKARARGAGARAGGARESKKDVSLGNPAAARGADIGTAGGDGRSRGRKRAHEDLLNDRIEAMRVSSDGEGDPPHGGGGGGGGGKGRRRRGQARSLGEQEEEEEEEEEEDVDDEDLKPHFEDPTWLGELEPFALEGGESINPSINRYLRDYQREGVRWLHAKYRAGQGGILGDDMGLGKTVQSITLLSAVLRKSGTREDSKELRRRRKEGLPASATGLPWLIVAPASVVRVWMEHLRQWGYFSAYQLESRKNADDLIAALSAGRYEVVATSYDLLRACVDRLKTQRFDAVLFDEYHTIKSSSARVSQAACELKTKRVFGLTGTLIQNDMKELWFLLHLIDPLAVGEQGRFTEHFSEPIKRARAMNASASDRRLGEKRLKELDGIRDKNMIRRTKDEELSDVLKGKTDMVVFCDLSEVQRDLYRSVLSLPEFQLLARAKDPCDCGRSGKPTRAKCCYKVPYGRGTAGGVDDGIDGRAVLFRKFHPSLVECDKCPFCSQLVAVSKLQKIANHPCLLQENTRDPEVQRQHQRQFAEVAFTERAKEIMGGLERSQKFLDVAKVGVCGKMQSLEPLLSMFHKTRDKVLVFSWSTTMLDVLESFVGAKGYVYRRLDGNTSHKDRQARIKEFNSDRGGVFVFLISTRAGGQGLNLHTASRVVLYDVNWNPALELQAQDRAYRIGQKNKVAVYRLISKGTIEEMCYMRQIYKLQITSAAMGDQARGGRRQFNAGSKEQQGELFGIQNLLKFSDESLLKTLRMKHEAGLAAAASGGGTGHVRFSTLASQGGDVVGSNNHLGVVGVDAADEADLMNAMKTALGRAKEGIEAGGGQGPPEDSELAGLLGVLGVDAYTHDQLVAKDEGEEELAEESCDLAELSLSPLPHGGARNAMEETISKSRVRTSSSNSGGHLFPTANTGKTSRTGFVGGGGVGAVGGRGKPNVLTSHVPAAAATAAAAVSAGTTARKGCGAGASKSTAIEIAGEAGEGAPVPQPQQQQAPAKKRRNLDFGSSKTGARGGAGLPGVRPPVELFVPKYESEGAEDRNGRGS